MDLEVERPLPMRRAIRVATLAAFCKYMNAVEDEQDRLSYAMASSGLNKRTVIDYTVDEFVDVARHHLGPNALTDGAINAIRTQWTNSFVLDDTVSVGDLTDDQKADIMQLYGSGYI
jgi:hypothetical protein